MATRGRPGESKQQCQHTAWAGLVSDVFPQRGDPQGVSGVGFVHAPFFALAGIVNARQFS